MTAIIFYDKSGLFLLAHEFHRANVLGDDAVYAKDGHQLACKVTLSRKSTPIGTMINSMRE